MAKDLSIIKNEHMGQEENLVIHALAAFNLFDDFFVLLKDAGLGNALINRFSTGCGGGRHGKATWYGENGEESKPGEVFAGDYALIPERLVGGDPRIGLRNSADNGLDDEWFQDGHSYHTLYRSSFSIDVNFLAAPDNMARLRQLEAAVEAMPQPPLPSLIIDLESLYPWQEECRTLYQRNAKTLALAHADRYGFTPEYDANGDLTNFFQLLRAAHKADFKRERGDKSISWDDLTDMVLADLPLDSLEANMPLTAALQQFKKLGGRVALHTELTNNTYANDIVKQLGLSGLGTVINGYDNGNTRKGTSEGFERACFIMGFDPANTIYISNDAKCRDAAVKGGGQICEINSASQAAKIIAAITPRAGMISIPSVAAL